MKSNTFLTVSALGILAVVGVACVVEQHPADSTPATAAPAATPPPPATNAPAATTATPAATAPATTATATATAATTATPPPKMLSKPKAATTAADGGS